MPERAENGGNMEQTRKDALCGAGIDVEQTLERFMGRETMLEHFWQKFLAASSYQKLVASLQEGNAEKALFDAHTLKGEAVTLGFTDLHAAVLHLEMLLRAGDWEEAVARMPAVTSAYQRIQEVLQA